MITGDEGLSFGRTLRELRFAAGVTQAQLAGRAGLSPAAVRDLEQGRRLRPRSTSLARLTEALGLGPAEAERLARAADARQDGALGRVGHDLGRSPDGTGGLWIQVLGPVTAWRGGRSQDLGPVRQRAVLALLAFARDGPVIREKIVDAVWPGGPPTSARNKVQAYIGQLRRALDPGRQPRDPGGVLVSAGESYRLRADPDELDLLAFEQLVGRARAADQAALACELYEQALALWRGEPVADVPILRTHPAVAALSFRRASAVVDYAKVACPAGWHDRVLDHLRALTGQEPLNEPAHAWLMIALAGSGQQAAALEVFTGCRRRLDEQLGVYPGAELAWAHGLVLRQRGPVRPAKARPGPGSAASRGDALPGQDDGPGKRARDWTGPHRLVPRQLPPMVPHFVGRAAELSVLAGLGASARQAGGCAAAVSAIGGSAGVGKTTLAVHFAHGCAGEFPDGHLYADLRGFGAAGPPVAPADVLGGFLDALHVPPERVPDGLAERAALYRSVLAGQRVLVLLDNARDEQQVRPLIPAGAPCLTLVTSRRRLTGLAVTAGAALVELDVPSDAESVELLSARLGPERVAAEPVAASELARLCARLPLGLVIAAARAAAHPQFPLAAAVAELQDAGRRLDALDTGDPSVNVRAVFDWSYENLSEPAARMFRLLGVHSGPDISVPAAASLAGITRPRAAGLLDELARAHLTDERMPGRFAFHDLLRAYARELVGKADSEAECRAAIHRVLDHYLHSADAADRQLSPSRYRPALAPPQPGAIPECFASDRQALIWFEAEHAVLRAAITQATAARFDMHAWQLPRALGPFLDRRGLWHEWASSQHAAFAAARRAGDTAGQALVLFQLGRVQTLLGAHEDARAHLTQALGLWRRLGDRKPQADTVHALSHLLILQGRKQEATRREQQALKLYRALGSRPGQAHALNALGWIYATLGRREDAIAALREAIALQTELGDRFGQAQAWDTLGSARLMLGDHAEAVVCCERALDLCRQIGTGYYEAETLIHLGDAHLAVDDPGAARAVWQQALPILEDMRNPGADRVRAKLDALPPTS